MKVDLSIIDWQAIGAIATALVAALALSERLLGLWERVGIGTRWLGETDADGRRAAVVLRAMFEYGAGEVQLSEDEGAGILPLNEGISIQPRPDHGCDPLELISPGFVRANLQRYSRAIEHLSQGGYLESVSENRWRATVKLEDIRRNRLRYRRLLWKGKIRGDTTDQIDRAWKNARYQSETAWKFDASYSYEEGESFLPTGWYLPPYAVSYSGGDLWKLGNAALMVLHYPIGSNPGDTIEFDSSSINVGGEPTEKPSWWHDKGMFLLRVYSPEEWNGLMHSSRISEGLCMAWVGHFPARVDEWVPQGMTDDEYMEKVAREWNPVEDFRRDTDKIMQSKEYKDLFRSYPEWLSDQEDSKVKPSRVARIANWLRNIVKE